MLRLALEQVMAQGELTAALDPEKYSWPAVVRELLPFLKATAERARQ